MTWRSADSDWDQFPPSPFCKPDWRWRFAQHTLRTRVRARRNEDEHVLLALRFLRVSQLAHSRGKMHLMSDRWSNIAQAYSIYLESGERRAETEARLLCQPIALVSEKMGLSVEVLKSFARVFYDVIDIEPITDWLIYEAAGVGRWFRQPPTEAEIWKYWALLGGPTALESLIDDFRRPDSPEAAGEYLEAERVRYLARDFAAQLRNGPIMDRAMLAERQRLFAESDRRRSPDDPFFGHLKFMEWWPIKLRLKELPAWRGPRVKRRQHVENR
jgi:hypothetical protein